MVEHRRLHGGKVGVFPQLSTFQAGPPYPFVITHHLKQTKHGCLTTFVLNYVMAFHQDPGHKFRHSSFSL